MMIHLTNIENDISRQAARNSGMNISFNADRQGNAIVDDYIKTLQDFAEWMQSLPLKPPQEAIAQDVFDSVRDRLKRKTEAWINARSRCASTMITGPANFNTRRAEKANQSEAKHCIALCDFTRYVQKYAVKKFASVWTPQEKQAREIEDLKEKLAKAEAFQTRMKAVNACLRKNDNKGLEEQAKLFCGESTHYIHKVMNDWKEEGPYPRFQMTNNLANIKRMKSRLKELESKAQAVNEVGEARTEWTGLTIVKNYEADRLQLVFNGKPDEEVRGLLKSRGFKWSPHYSAWQRKLTKEAVYAFKHYIANKPQFTQYLPTAS